jgi:hypothetical protein
MNIKIGSLLGGRGGAPDLLADGLSSKEMLIVTGLTVERLMAWYKRKLLPDDILQAHTGRGNRTRYSRKEVYFLALTRVLVDAGLPIEDAGILGKRFAVMVQMYILGLIPPGLTIEESMPHLRDFDKPLSLILRRPAGYRPDAVDFVSPQFVAVSAQPGDTVIGIRDWARDLGADYFTVLDIASVTAMILAGFREVLTAR